MIEVESDIMKEFFNKVAMGGMVDDCVVNLGEDGMRVCAFSPDNTQAVNSFVAKDLFDKYKVDEKYCFGNTVDDSSFRLAQTIFNNIKGKVNCAVQEEVFVIQSENEGAQIVQADESLIDSNDEKIPGVFKSITEKNTVNFEIDTKVFSRAIKNADSLTTKSGTPTILVSAKNNVLKIESKRGKNNLWIETQLDGNVDDFSVKFGVEKFKPIVSCLTAKRVKINASTDKPIIISEETNITKTQYLLAPRVSEEDE